MLDFTVLLNTLFEVNYLFHRTANQYYSSLYCEGLSETLHQEISPLGLRSICFDPGYFRTEFLASDNRAPFDPRIADYRPMAEAVEAALSGK